MSLIATLLSGEAPTFHGRATTYLVEQYRDNPLKVVAPKPEHVPGANMIEKRRKNREVIINLIRAKKVTSSEVMKKTKVCRTSVHNITNELITEGLITCEKSRWPWVYSITVKGKKP